MSMLAEKKRREKWSLNPRGKAWSEDQNKFGQRLMEKMGWKAGQGLGANGQGQTDIVKARVKNDNKGLGFKENGEEWLKTTSDFEILLDKLASSQEDSGEGSQTDAPVSLEDRSKKSRARVHYHKFTRGKDISRYSEKDLASIIGPDAVKLMNVQESKSDYTQNQINKGSLEEYFSKKTKSKDNKLVDNTISEDQETVMNPNTELRNVDENYAETEDAIPPREKKKRKKGNSDESETLVNISIEDNENIGMETDKHDSQTEVSIKKKKRKSGSSFDNSMNELEESDQNRLDLATSGSSKKVKKEKKSNPETEENVQSVKTFDVSHSNDKIYKNNKRKHEEYPHDIETSVYLENSDSETKNDTGGKTMKIKKQKFDREEVVQMEFNEECTDNKLITEESIVDEETVSKKKKKRSKDGNKVLQEETLEVHTEYSEDCVSINPVVDQEAVDNDNIVSKKKKKKSKDEKNKHQEDPLKVQTERNVECTDSNLLAAEEALDNNNVVSKKKKKKRKDENHENQEEYPLEEEQAVIKQKKEKIDKQFDEECTNETTPRFEKVVTPKKSGDFLEVLGRKTRLKNIISIPKKAADSYQTEEFMSLGKSDNIEDNTFSKLKPVERPCIVNTDSENLTRSAVKNVELHKTDQTKIVENKHSIITSCEKGESKLNNENANCFKCYAEVNDDDCNVPKHLVAYEYRLVNARLKALEITPPDIKVVNLESNTLNETTSRKLKQITKTRHLKCLLPPNDVTEIESSVSKFYDHLKPKIEIMAVLTELDDKIYEIAGNLDGKADTKVNEAEGADDQSLISEKDGKADLKVNEVEAVDVKSLISEKVAGLTNLFQKLENLVENFRKTKDESSSSGLTHKEFPGAEDAEDQPESRLLWVKRVEDKLETLKEHVKMLEEGKKPPDIKTIREYQPATRKKKIQPERFKSYSHKKLYKNKIHSRGRIAHNISNQRGTDIQRGKLTAKSAVPSGDWGVLKSNISGKLPEHNKKIRKLPELNKISGKLTKFNSQSQKVSGGFGDSQGFMGRGRGGLDNSKGFMGQGRGGLGQTQSFMGRGRGGFGDTRGFMGRGRGGFGDRRGFMGRGRGGFGDSQGHMGRGRGGSDDSQGSMGRGRGGFGDSQGSMGRGRCGFGDSQGFIGQGGGGFGDSQGSIGRGGGFGDSQGFMGRGGGGLGDSQGFMGRGGGGFGANRGFMGRGRGVFGNSQGFMGRGGGGFGGSRGFIGHGRCDFRGRGRFDMRGRGRISQINFDAKQYAEKCKELNKLPEVCFNGVNMKVISGYAANVSVDQNIASCNNDSKSVGNQPNTKEISKAVAV